MENKSARMPVDSVRGRIRKFLETSAHRLGDNVLEIGSRIHDPAAWWIGNRDLATGAWTGVDFQPGDGVDIVGDIETGEGIPVAEYSGIVCSEVLEHVKRPWRAMQTMADLLQPGGTLLITTLTTFHIHGYPDDYWRFTTSGLRLLIKDAGMECIQCFNEGDTVLKLKNHEERVFKKRAPLQVFAVAVKPDFRAMFVEATKHELRRIEDELEKAGEEWIKSLEKKSGSVNQ